MVQRTQKAGQRYWLFQFAVRDDVSDVRRGHEQRWQARKDMAPGDPVVLWKPGTDAGVFGFGRLTSSLENKAFWNHPTSVRWRCTGRLRVPLAKGELSGKVQLLKIPVVAGKGFGAGVFKITVGQWEEINALAASAVAQKHNGISARRYWLFQANPRGGDHLRFFLRGKKCGDKIWWRASLFRNPREHMCAEDGVVLWQTRGDQPDAAGVYAIGRLTGNLHHSGTGGWQAQVELDRIRSIEDPISPQKLRSQKILRDLPVLRPSGAMGSNFHLTKGEWYGFLSVWGLSRDIGEGPIAEDKNSKQELRSSERVSLAGARKGSSVVRARESYEMEWPEDALVEQYVVYMGHKGATMSLRKKCRLRCDLYDDIRKDLIEAKASAARESIRMAIGELADYRRFVKPRYVSVLLPSRPEKDLENLLHTQGIFVIWRSGKGFEDNARGRFS